MNVLFYLLFSYLSILFKLVDSTCTGTYTNNIPFKEGGYITQNKNHYVDGTATDQYFVSRFDGLGTGTIIGYSITATNYFNSENVRQDIEYEFDKRVASTNSQIRFPIPYTGCSSGATAAGGATPSALTPVGILKTTKLTTYDSTTKQVRTISTRTYSEICVTKEVVINYVDYTETITTYDCSASNPKSITYDNILSATLGSLGTTTVTQKYSNGDIQSIRYEDPSNNLVSVTDYANGKESRKDTIISDYNTAPFPYKRIVIDYNRHTNTTLVGTKTSPSAVVTIFSTEISNLDPTNSYELKTVKEDKQNNIVLTTIYDGKSTKYIMSQDQIQYDVDGKTKLSENINFFDNHTQITTTYSGGVSNNIQMIDTIEKDYNNKKKKERIEDFVHHRIEDVLYDSNENKLNVDTKFTDDFGFVTKEVIQDMVNYKRITKTFDTTLYTLETARIEIFPSNSSSTILIDTLLTCKDNKNVTTIYNNLPSRTTTEPIRGNDYCPAITPDVNTTNSTFAPVVNTTNTTAAPVVNTTNTTAAPVVNTTNTTAAPIVNGTTAIPIPNNITTTSTPIINGTGNNTSATNNTASNHDSGSTTYISNTNNTTISTGNGNTVINTNTQNNTTLNNNNIGDNNVIITNSSITNNVYQNDIMKNNGGSSNNQSNMTGGTQENAQANANISSNGGNTTGIGVNASVFSASNIVNNYYWNDIKNFFGGSCNYTVSCVCHQFKDQCQGNPNCAYYQSSPPPDISNAVNEKTPAVLTCATNPLCPYHFNNGIQTVLNTLVKNADPLVYKNGLYESNSNTFGSNVFDQRGQSSQGNTQSSTLNTQGITSNGNMEWNKGGFSSSQIQNSLTTSEGAPSSQNTGINTAGRSQTTGANTAGGLQFIGTNTNISGGTQTTGTNAAGGFQSTGTNTNTAGGNQNTGTNIVGGSQTTGTDANTPGGSPTAATNGGIQNIVSSAGSNPSSPSTIVAVKANGGYAGSGDYESVQANLNAPTYSSNYLNTSKTYQNNQNTNTYQNNQNYNNDQNGNMCSCPCTCQNQKSNATGTYESSIVSASSLGTCNNGMIPVSVEWIGTFCSYGPVCSGQNSAGLCPGPQVGLEQGSVCGLVGPEQKVYGCKLANATNPQFKQCEQSSYGKYPVSVVGAGTFCMNGPSICSGTSGGGSCPIAQPGLENGARCDLLPSGVYGCLAGAASTGAVNVSVRSVDALQSASSSSSNALVISFACIGTAIVILAGVYYSRRNRRTINNANVSLSPLADREV